MEENLKTIFILGPSGAGKTTLSISLAGMLDGLNISIDEYFNKVRFHIYDYENYTKESMDEWYNKVAKPLTKYLNYALNNYTDTNKINVVDLGGVASFPNDYEITDYYKSLVEKYENFFILLPSAKLCESAEISCRRRFNTHFPIESFIAGLNSKNLSRMNKLYEIFPEYDGTAESIQHRIIYQNEYPDIYKRSSNEKWLEEEIIERCNFSQTDKNFCIENINKTKENSLEQ